MWCFDRVFFSSPGRWSLLFQCCVILPWILQSGEETLGFNAVMYKIQQSNSFHSVFCGVGFASESISSWTWSFYLNNFWFSVRIESKVLCGNQRAWVQVGEQSAQCVPCRDAQYCCFPVHQTHMLHPFRNTSSLLVLFCSLSVGTSGSLASKEQHLQILIGCIKPFKWKNSTVHESKPHTELGLIKSPPALEFCLLDLHPFLFIAIPRESLRIHTSCL